LTGVEALGVASLALAAVGTATGVVGGIEQANAAKNQANYQAQVAANNATIARYNAQQAGEAGASTEEALGLRNRAAAADVLAGEAAGGVDVNSGSNLDVQKSQRITGLEDVAQAQHNAFMQAYGYNTQALGYQSQAGLYSSEASNATAEEPLVAGSALATGAASGLNTATKLQQSGAFANPTTAQSLTIGGVSDELPGQY
jgi:hypothetical protein